MKKFGGGMKNLYGDGKVRGGKDGSREGGKEGSLSVPTCAHISHELYLFFFRSFPL